MENRRGIDGLCVEDADGICPSEVLDFDPNVTFHRAGTFKMLWQCAALRCGVVAALGKFINLALRHCEQLTEWVWILVLFRVFE
jgi:hypothetical protein